MNLFGFEVEVLFLTRGSDVLAYAWHYKLERAERQLERIREFHTLHGEVTRSEELEGWLERMLHGVVIEGVSFTLPNARYRYEEVYRELLKVPKGETLTYSELARRAGVRYQDVIKSPDEKPPADLDPLSSPSD